MRFAGFNPLRLNNGSMNLPGVETFVIDGSVTVNQGSALKIGVADGLDVADANSDEIYGYCLAFIIKPGSLNLPLELVSTNSTYNDGTYTAARDGDTFAAASDNATDKQISAVVMPARGLICSAHLDADAGTTTGSNIPGYFIDILAGNAAVLLDESAASTTSANYSLTTGMSANSAVDPSFPDTDDRRILVIANEVTGT